MCCYNFSEVGKVLGGWVWSDESLLILDFYSYLVVEFSSDTVGHGINILSH